MNKAEHEFRDPVHVFIRLDPDERKVVDSPPFQRLRHLHQLAMTYMVYPGASHRRFEHSLGCMELASRIFDVITKHHVKLPTPVRDRLPELFDKNKLCWWRKILRFAALCHDLGHLPFSHATEGLLPDKVNHETMTQRIILEEMGEFWSKLTHSQPDSNLIAKLAVGPKEAKGLGLFSPWERILSGIITGDIFGADRMDYLLRDSLHVGVSYGHFDHHRLIDTIRILPGSAQDPQEKYNPEPELGIELGGLQVAESLLVARYMMFTQVYFHPVRRSYDLHLKSFLKQALPNGIYPTDLPQFLATTDSDILVAIREKALDSRHVASRHAQCIERRRHFKKAYHAIKQDTTRRHDILAVVAAGLVRLCGEENVMLDDYGKETAIKSDFPIMADDGRILSAHGESKVMTSLPIATTGYVFVAPELRDKACAWVKENLNGFVINEGGKPCSIQYAQP